MPGRLPTLERVANIAIVLCSLFFVATLARVWLPARQRPSTPAGSGYAVGETIPPLPGLATNPGPDVRFLLLINTNCGYCTDNMPFFRELLRVRGNSTGAFRLVVAARQPRAEVVAYLARHGVEPDAVIAIPRESAFRVATVPMLLQVDPKNSVQRLWRGALAEQSKQEIIMIAGHDAPKS